ncbi:hypothetical protein QLQ12_15240 [Actinoplanes sp. NEAU-A12]|uniref:ESX-1 secretion-associated protein n=1 Tax=Actinoplanes sandaracinus TaxID=3045177 RepID=A0ABT6WJP9_9ACTN|nr:hypothetical protein [Actinoplanes sandaracinus]MDI6099954.1 hypothetical protein [Actinoplanes sandaracinus]
MTDRLPVDPASLEGIAGAGAPAASGADTPIFNELLARHTLDATGLAAGLGAAAARVVQGGQTYADEDLSRVRDVSGGR